MSLQFNHGSDFSHHHTQKHNFHHHHQHLICHYKPWEILHGWSSSMGSSIVISISKVRNVELKVDVCPKGNPSSVCIHATPSTTMQRLLQTAQCVTLQTGNWTVPHSPWMPIERNSFANSAYSSSFPKFSRIGALSLYQSWSNELKRIAREE